MESSRLSDNDEEFEEEKDVKCSIYDYLESGSSYKIAFTLNLDENRDVGTTVFPTLHMRKLRHRTKTCPANSQVQEWLSSWWMQTSASSD